MTPASHLNPNVGAEARERYWEVVRRLAADDGPDFQHVCVVLASVGRNANDLAADVAAHRSRTGEET